jgi:hypothetical protein
MCTFLGYNCVGVNVWRQIVNGRRHIAEEGL